MAKKSLQEENKFHKNEIAYLYKMQGTLNLYDVWIEGKRLSQMQKSTFSTKYAEIHHNLGEKES